MFLTRAADQVHVAFMPDTTWPIIEHPPDSSRSYQLGSGFDATSSNLTTRHQRFTRVRLPDPHLTPLTAPFPHRSPRSRHRSRSIWRFEASPRRAAPEGQTSISRKAPQKRQLPTKLPPSCSWHTLNSYDPRSDHNEWKRLLAEADVRDAACTTRGTRRDRPAPAWRAAASSYGDHGLVQLQGRQAVPGAPHLSSSPVPYEVDRRPSTALVHQHCHV